MTVLIADDEPVARQVLREHVEAIPSLEIAGEASTGKETLQRILDLDPDVVLLDQQMPELDGLAVVRSLRGARTPLIIFVTAYERHALEAFEVGAVDYLLKPVRRERLEKAIEKARRQLKSPRRSRVRRRSWAAAARICTCWIRPRSSRSRRTASWCTSLPPASAILSDHSLKALEEKLERPRFRRVHRGTLINTDHLRKISPLSSRRWLLKMSNGFEAVVSKRLASAIREQARW